MPPGHRPHWDTWFWVHGSACGASGLSQIFPSSVASSFSWLHFYDLSPERLFWLCLHSSHIIFAGSRSCPSFPDGCELRKAKWWVLQWVSLTWLPLTSASQGSPWSALDGPPSQWSPRVDTEPASTHGPSQLDMRPGVFWSLSYGSSEKERKVQTSRKLGGNRWTITLFPGFGPLLNCVLCTISPTR